MPQPTLSDVHVDSLLTDMSVSYVQDAKLFAAERMFPAINVAKQSNKYRIYTKNDFRRNEMKRLGPGAESFEAGYGLSSSTYSCDVWALGHFVDDQIAANYDAPGGAEEDAAILLSQMALINREVEFMTAFFTTSIWGTDTTVGDQWSNSTSDPKLDVQGAQSRMLKSTGQLPNRMLVGYEVHQALQRHPLVREQFKYTSADSIDEAMLARFFGVDQYVVAAASYSTNNEGETAANAFIAGKHCLLAYAADRPSPMQPSAGYTFRWAGLAGAGDGSRILRFEVPTRHGVKLEIQSAYDMVVTGSDLGEFFPSVVA